MLLEMGIGSQSLLGLMVGFVQSSVYRGFGGCYQGEGISRRCIIGDCQNLVGLIYLSYGREFCKFMLY